MTQINAKEMRSVNGGTIYTVECPYCGVKFSGSYSWWNKWGVIRVTDAQLKAHKALKNWRCTGGLF